jgi:pimeloyl-ACP methyl ester carboxylesterase
LPAGHRIVVLDLLGYGRSDPGHGMALSLCAHADRLVAVLDQLRIERACLVGHGIGGGIAQVVAIRHPARVSHLCLMGSVRLGAPAGVVMRAVAGAARVAPSAWTRSALRSTLVRGYADRDKGARSLDLFLRPFEGPAGRDALLAHVSALRSEDTRPLAERLSTVGAPAAVLWGSDDPFLPRTDAHALAGAIPGCTLDIADGARHFVPTDAAHGVAATIAGLLRRRPADRTE